MGKIPTLLIGLAILVAMVAFVLSDGTNRGALPEIAPRTQSQRPREATVAEPAEERLEPRNTPHATDGARQPTARNQKRVPQRRLEGRVIGRDAPVPAAQVSVYSSGRLIGNVQSDPTGTFVLPFPVPAVELILRIDARDFAVYELDLGSQHAAGRTKLGNVSLRTGTVLSGIVVDGEERPVAAASVTLSQLRGRALEHGLGERTRTDATGRFTFTRAPTGLLTLTARASGYGERALGHEHTPGAEARIELGPGSEVRIRVVDQRERPIAGAKLTLRSPDPVAPARTEWSDAEGAAVFSDLGATRWNLNASVRGYRPGRLANLDPGSGVAFLRLVEWPKASGEVRTPTDEPLPDGTSVLAVLASQPAGFAALMGTRQSVGKGGTYVIDDLRPGSYRVRAIAPGYAPTDSEAFGVGESGITELPPITLERGGVLLLRITCAGEPAADVRVELLRSAPRPAELWRRGFGRTAEQAVSRADGKVLIDGLALGKLWLILRSDEFVARQFGPLTITRASATVPETHAELRRGGSIAGRVVSSTGAAATRARVHVKGVPQGMHYLETDAHGHFETQPLPPGTYRLNATTFIGEETVEGTPLEIAVTTGQVARVELTFEEPFTPSKK